MREAFNMYLLAEGNCDDGGSSGTIHRLKAEKCVYVAGGLSAAVDDA